MTGRPGSPLLAAAHPDTEAREETTVNTTPTLVTETTGQVTSPRPNAAYACATNGIEGRIAGTAWLVATRKSMTVPSFHDRWPLCSDT